MALTNFIPTVWSETLYRELDAEYVGVKNCNREFEGDIRKCGDTVNICGIGDIAVFSYSKNSDISNLQTLDSTKTQLLIDQSNGFNFQIDDIDRAQSNPKVMQHAMRQAANALAKSADDYVFGLYSTVDADHTLSKSAVTAENILDTLIEARKMLMLHNVGATDEVVLEVTPEVAAVILKAKIAVCSDTEPLENGCIGSVVGFKIYVSNNVKKVAGEDDAVSHKCFARTRRAIAFAEQLNDVEAYRPEKRFADAIKGLHLFGAKVIYANELVLLDLTLA